MAKSTPQLLFDPYMCRSYEKRSRSPLVLYSEYQCMDVELRTPLAMTYSRWHSQVEVNVPFDGDVEYLFNDEVVKSKQGFIALFWTCIPHQFTDVGHCKRMVIFNLPMHLFLPRPLGRELINHVIHRVVITSLVLQQLSAFEVQRWQDELNSDNEQIRQLAVGEIALMLKHFSLAGWRSVLDNKTSRTQKDSISWYSQLYVSQMLEFITANCDRQLIVSATAERVKLSPNYTMGIFRRVMQLAMRQYTTAMRINHAWALLSDTDKTILDIATITSFRSSSRFYGSFHKYVGMPPQQYRKLSQQRRHHSPCAEGQFIHQTFSYLTIKIQTPKQ